MSLLIPTDACITQVAANPLSRGTHHLAGGWAARELPRAAFQGAGSLIVVAPLCCKGSYTRVKLIGLEGSKSQRMEGDSAMPNHKAGRQDG